jgi:hypothetical protein
MGSINDDYILVQDICNKNQQGYVKPDQFNLYYNRAQDEFVDYLLGEFQQYKVGRSQPIVSYSQNATVRNRLTPVIYGYVLHPDSYGQAPYTGDFLQVDSMLTITGQKRIREADNPREFSFANSRIDPVATNPIYLLRDTHFQFYPVDIAAAQMYYVRKPPRVEWAYSLDANGEPVYDPINSIDCVFYETDIMSILGRVLRMIGVSLQDNQISAYAQELKNQGQ